MTIQMVNGYPVYAVTKKEVAYHPSYFQQQAEKWVEGSKKINFLMKNWKT